MKKISLFLILIFFSLSVFSQTQDYSFDALGNVIIDSDFAAGVIANTLTSNFLDLSALTALQSNSKEKFYWDSDSKKTVLDNVPVGRAYRVIENKDEFSPYWIGVQSIDGKEVEIIAGFIAKPAYVWHLRSKDYPFVKLDDCFEWEIGFEEGMTRTCFVQGIALSVKIISVNPDNTVSLEITYFYTPSTKDIPKAIKLEEGKYSIEYIGITDSTIKLYKLEGLPFFVYDFGVKEFMGTAKPNFEFNFIPDNTVTKGLIQNYSILKRTELKNNTIEFSINEQFLLLGKPPLKETVFPKKEKVSLTIFVGFEVYEYLNQGKLIFDFYDTTKAETVYLSLNDYMPSVSGIVPKNSYQLKLISNSPELKDWVSNPIQVLSDNTVIDLTKDIKIKKETAKIEVLIPEEVVNAMDSVSVAPIIEDSTGKEVFVPFTTLKVSYPEPSNNWPFLFPLGEELTIQIPETTATKKWIWEGASENGTKINVPETIVKGTPIKPDNKFIVTVVIGKENYNLFEKKDFENIIDFVPLQEDKDILAINPDTTKKDRFTAELIKGKKYNLVINESEFIRYYNYLAPIRAQPLKKPIDETDSGSEIDLSSEFFGKSKSEFFNALAFEEAMLNPYGFELNGQQKDLQIKSVNGSTCTEIVCEENKMPHIVYLNKGTSQILIDLENYNSGRIFVSIGEKGIQQPKTSTENSLEDYPLKDYNIFGAENAPVFDFSEVKTGLRFSLDSYSGDLFGITNWDGTPFQFFVCQDKTGDKKCDLKGYDSAGKEVFGGTFTEPNFEAASIEVKVKSQTELTEISIIIECDLEAECPEDVKEDALAEILKQFTGDLKDLEFGPAQNYPDATKVVIEIYDEQEVSLESFKVQATFDETYICDQPPAPETCALVNESYVCDTSPAPEYFCLPSHGTTSTMEFTPTDDSVVLTPGKEEKIIFKAKATTKQTERFGTQSTECITAMKNAKNYETEINKYAGLYSIDRDLIRGIIQSESSFNPDKIGDDGKSYGLMQVSDDNLKVLIGLDWENKWNIPEENINAGTKFFNEIKEKIISLNCDNLTDILPNSGIAKATWKNALTIAAYNSGLGNVSCNEIKIESTRQTHVPRVIAWYRIFKENYGKEIELGDGYCKPTEVSDATEPVVPVGSPEACKNCSNIIECLACLDYKFVSGVFE